MTESANINRGIFNGVERVENSVKILDDRLKETNAALIRIAVALEKGKNKKDDISYIRFLIEKLPWEIKRLFK
jgi:hypothetical protein